MENSGKVYFVGAGPGDPELLTLKGKRLLGKADVIVYAGSLVNPALLTEAKPDALIYDSSGMTLGEIAEVLTLAATDGKLVVRLHTGDPTLYSAVGEQAYILKERGIDYEVVPGVSSFSASAAALGCEFTKPGVSQTLILTRVQGRTDVPQAEDLESLASHKTSMALFLSVGLVEKVEEALIETYGPETPAAVVYKASWPEERIIRTTVGNLTRDVRKAGINRTSQILIGDFLDPQKGERSKLYDSEFTHGCRNGRTS